MKYALFVLLATCALAAHGQKSPSLTALELQPEFRGPVIDGIKQAFKDVIEFVNNTLATINDKAKEIMDKIYGNIGGIIGDAMKKLWEILKTIAKIAEKGIVAKVCYQPHADRIAELQAEIEQGMQVCTAHAMEEINVAKEAVEDAVRQIRMLADDLMHMFKNCFDSDGNILNGAWCVVKNIFEIRDKVKDAQEIAENALEEVQRNAEKIFENYQNCAASVQEVPMTELMQIVAEIQQCIAENS